MKKTTEEIVTLLNELSKDAEQWSTDQGDRKRSAGVHQVESSVAMQAQIAAMAKDIKQLMLAQVQNQPQVGGDICRLGHPTYECQTTAEEVNVVGNFNRGNYQGAKSRAPVQAPPGFQTQQRQPYQPPLRNNSSLEDLMKAFINNSDKKLETQGTAIREQGTAIQNLERQMRHLAPLLSERAPGTLPADTEKNPKETIKDVSPRSGKTLAEPKSKPRDEKEINSTKIAEEQKIGEFLPKENVSNKDVDKQKVNNAVEESKHMPLLPFPQEMKREKLDKYFGEFLEMLKQLYVNIPFTEVLAQMPAYAKFLKEILSSKRKLEETKVVKLNARCSAILQNKISKK
ncbi:uncharacterized protein [Nicotiana tomentosiformis]|uniref:uncharacterized protein n=1 Tax=Nicotiana tomentosiformis TaxID=4098 RepID=UPI00388CE819